MDTRTKKEISDDIRKLANTQSLDLKDVGIEDMNRENLLKMETILKEKASIPALSFPPTLPTLKRTAIETPPAWATELMQKVDQIDQRTQTPTPTETPTPLEPGTKVETKKVTTKVTETKSKEPKLTIGKLFGRRKKG